MWQGGSMSLNYYCLVWDKVEALPLNFTSPKVVFQIIQFLFPVKWVCPSVDDSESWPNSQSHCTWRILPTVSSVAHQWIMVKRRMDTLMQELVNQSVNRPWLFWLLLWLQPYCEATQYESSEWYRHELCIVAIVTKDNVFFIHVYFWFSLVHSPSPVLFDNAREFLSTYLQFSSFLFCLHLAHSYIVTLLLLVMQQCLSPLLS